MPDNNKSGTVVTAVVAVATAVIVLSVALRLSWSRSGRGRNQNGKRKKMDPSLMFEFEKAATKMKSSKFSSKLQLTTNDKLMLYGWYKQVIVGDAPLSLVPNDKSWNVMEQAAKYKAWCHVRGMSEESAAMHYVTAVEHFESVLDWEGSDSEEDDDSVNAEGAPTMPAVSRPLEQMNDINDHYDDAVHDDGSASYESQLLRAASENNIKHIRILLDNTPSSLVKNVNHADPAGQTALHLAADKGSLEALQLLINEYHAAVNSVDCDGISVLQTAVIAGQYMICEWLLNNTDVNADQADYDGETPRSCAQDDVKMKMLFEKV